MDSNPKYSDYIDIPRDYRPCTTVQNINETEERWMDFYPHEEYVTFLRMLMDLVDGEPNPTIWLYGDYGTGKSSAALVTQKLYIDDIGRVEKWFDLRKLNQKDPGMLDRIKKQRDGTLFIYDYNSSSISDSNDSFIVRLESVIVKNLEDRKLKIPCSSENIEGVFKKLDLYKDEGFMELVDKYRDDLTCVTEYTSIESIKKAIVNKETTDNPLSDVEKILRKEDIFLTVTVEKFKKWIDLILKENGKDRIVYMFDEFSGFIDKFKSNLKTFEQVAEDPHKSNFIFIPITHTNVEAFTSEDKNSAGKSINRFIPVKLKMPDDIAFKLVASAIHVKEEKAVDWEENKVMLWDDVKPIAQKVEEEYNIDSTVLKDIFPIHPITGLLLKYIAQEVSSNQRSIFGYLKDESDKGEFQNYIMNCGPYDSLTNFLTPDYLWSYFIESASDIGIKPEVSSIRNYYNSLVSRKSIKDAFANEPKLDKIFKTILIYELLTRLGGSVDKKFAPTRERIFDSFVGPNLDTNPFIDKLAELGCIAVVNDSISISMNGMDMDQYKDLIESKKGKFNEMMGPIVEEHIKHSIGKLGVFSTGRFDFKATAVNKTILSNFDKNAYDRKHGKVCLWTVFSKSVDDNIDRERRIKDILSQFETQFRVIILDISSATFCRNEITRWDDYVKYTVIGEKSTDNTIKNDAEFKIKRYADTWKKEIESSMVTVCYYDKDEGVHKEPVSFDGLVSFLRKYLGKVMPCCPDLIIDHASGCKDLVTQFIKMGIDPKSVPNTNQFKPFFNEISTKVDWTPTWFDDHPDHPITKYRNEILMDCKKAFDSKNNYDLRKTITTLRGNEFGLSQSNTSGFIIGFCMKDFISQGLILDNGPNANDLSVDNLSALIKSAISSSTGTPTIRSVSEEDKAFIKYAPRMFGLSPSGEGNIKMVVNSITTGFSSISNRVPLWVLPDHIDANGDPKADKMRSLIENITKICRISSKGNVQEYSDAIKNVGTLFIEDPDLAADCSKYMKSLTLKQAFTEHLQKEYPDLIQQAESLDIDQVSYTNAVLNKMSADAGYLWVETNLAENVREVQGEYNIVEIFRPLFTGDVKSYDSLIRELNRMIMEECKLPRQMILSAHDSLTSLLNCLEELDRQKDVGSLDRMAESSRQNLDIIRNMFFDPENKEILGLIRSKAGDLKGLDDSELNQIYKGMEPWFKKNESEFIATIRKKCGEYAQGQIHNKIKEIWCQKTSSNGPRGWSEANHMPASFSMYALNERDRDLVIQCFTNPKMVSSEAMEDLLAKLGAWEYDYPGSKAAFMKWAIPERFSEMNIQFSMVTDYMSEKFGSTDRWRNDSAEDMIRRYYKKEFAPGTKERVRTMDPNKLKEILLECLDDNPDIGMLFWK